MTYIHIHTHIYMKIRDYSKIGLNLIIAEVGEPSLVENKYLIRCSF